MATEVFNRIGESEIHSGSSNFHRRQNEAEDVFEEPRNVEKIESKSALSDIKKEFFQHLEDESLTLDMCDKVNHDWKKK